MIDLNRIKGTKKELIQTFKKIRSDNFELLFNKLPDDNAFYYLNIKLYTLKNWTKLRIKALIFNLTIYINTNK